MITIYESTREEIEIEIEATEVSDGEKLTVAPPPEVEKNAEEPLPTNGLTQFANNFLQRYEKRLSEKKTYAGEKVRVSEVLGRLARLYERVRSTVEYKGENVLRRNAIERMLKRLVWEQETVRSGLDSERVASTLVKELTWARYLPNNTVSEARVKEVAKTVDKYSYLLNNLDNLPPGVTKHAVREWIWGVASSELEDLLDPSNREIYVKLMHEWFVNYFNWQDELLDDHEKQIQIYLAVHRAFTKSDDSIMRYHLLLKEFPDWQKADRYQVTELILSFPQIYSEIERHLNFFGKLSLYRKIQKEVAAFEIFSTIARQEKANLEKLLLNKKKFEKRVIEVCEARYLQIKSKVNTGIVRSIIYIFLTKVFLALLIEVPYEILRFDEVRYIPLSINIMLPPLLMWIIGFSIRIPGAKNTQKIVDRLVGVIYAQEEIPRLNFSINQSRKKSTLVQVFGLVYALLFLLVFGGLSYLLVQLNFTFVGIAIFFIFLSLVVLFAFRIRFNANELKVDTEEEGLLDHLFSYLTLPFLNLGFYLSKGLAKLNFLTVILDFLIEAPLKSVIEIFEEWTSFLRQKKEEVVEVPE